jgi:para-aminobenzoate synthetase
VTDPVERFVAMAAEHERCFWLDGGGARPWSGHRSLLGWLDEDDVSLTYDAARGEVVRHRGDTSEVVGDDVFAALEAESAADGPGVHWVGYLGYASRPDLPALLDPADRMPTAVWMRTTHVDVVEHPERPAEPVTANGAGEVEVPEDYAAAFADVQEHLRAGNSYEVNLTHRLRVQSDLDPVTAYLRLRELNPAPYAGFLQHRGRWLLSSSPERYATIDRHRRIETKPIKGTTPRGGTPAEDGRLRELLATDPKFRAENLMIVDLLRNDIAMVGEVGSVQVPVLMDVESYPSVHQLVSTVRGVLREDVTTIGALRALFPAGSMTGAPKLRTMEVIRDVEATARGVYSGAFGWISGDGRADLGVVIRSLTTAGDGTWTLGTGGGITVRSDVVEEYAESRWKAERLLRVFDRPG